MSYNLFLKHLLVNIGDFELEKRIGNGAFGVVFKAVNKKDGQNVALKAVQQTELLKMQKQQRNIIQEISIPRLLNLPGIVQLLGFRFPLTDEQKAKEVLKEIETRNKEGKKEMVDLTGALLVTELMPNGSLDTITVDYLNSKGHCDKMNPTIRSKIIYGIAATMKKVHKKNVIHRDLKPENIFLDENLEPRIADFGLSKVLMDKVDMTMAVGTPFFMAPELFMDGDEYYTIAVDVYAFAFILYKMFTNKIEFPDKRPIRGYQQYMMKISRKMRPVRPEYVSDPYWDLIQACWDQEPAQRPTFEEICVELKDDKYALEEFGMKTDLDQLHEYQSRIEEELPPQPNPIPLPKPPHKTVFNWHRH